jgi:hypothetical protein
MILCISYLYIFLIINNVKEQYVYNSYPKKFTYVYTGAWGGVVVKALCY